MPELSVIIVNYNVKSYLEQALQSITKAVEKLTAEIIVVDNASSDGSVGMLRKQFPKIKCIANKENVGFARANNQALKIAKGKTCCLINPDTLVRKDTFRICLDYLASHADVGMVGCKILNPDGTLQLACRRSIPTPWIAFTKITGLSRIFPHSKLFGRYNLTYLDPDESTEVEAVSGSFMFARKSAIQEVGLLDEIFFMYGEDLDWCYRFIQAGWKIIYLPQTEIIHYKGRSTEEATFDSLKTFYNAMALFVDKHYKKQLSFVSRWFLLMGIWIRGAVSYMSHLAVRSLVPTLDLLFIQLSFMLGILQRFGDLEKWGSFGVVILIYTTVWLISFAAMGLYRRGVFSFSKALGGVLLGLMINTSLTFFLPQYQLSRHVVLVAGLCNIILLGGWRIFIRFAARLPGLPFLGRVGKTLARRRAVLVGIDPQASAIYQRLNTQMDSSYDILGCLALDEKDLDAADPKLPVIGHLQDLRRVVISHKIKDVIFTPGNIRYDDILSCIAQSQNMDVEYKMIPENMDVIIGRTSIDALEDVPLVSLDYQILGGFNQAMKRFFDIVVALMALIPCSLLLSILLLHPHYRLKSQVISDGFQSGVKIFELMHKGRDMTGLLRILPLLFSILTGKLSFVGTEIVPLGEGQGFKPGLTGLVQINRKKQLSDDEVKKYTLYYLKNYTLLLDFEILIRTVLK